MPQLSHRLVKDISYSLAACISRRMEMAAVAGRKAFSNRREQRSSQMRHPVHFEALDSIGRPFTFDVKLISFIHEVLL